MGEGTSSRKLIVSVSRCIHSILKTASAVKVRNLKTAELRHQSFYFKLGMKAIVIIIFLIFVAIISGLSCRCS